MKDKRIEYLRENVMENLNITMGILEKITENNSRLYNIGLKSTKECEPR